jgi:hypothetical protein
VLLAAGTVAMFVAWVKVLISVARTPLLPLPRTVAFGVTLFTGPLVGTVIGWLTLRTLGRPAHPRGPADQDRSAMD